MGQFPDNIAMLCYWSPMVKYVSNKLMLKISYSQCTYFILENNVLKLALKVSVSSYQNAI